MVGKAMGIELFLVGAVRAMVEVALLSLLGQGVVGVLSGALRAKNPIYRGFSIITRPPIRFVRLLTPALVIDRHIPYVTFFVLFWLWILLAHVKRTLCAHAGLVC